MYEKRYIKDGHEVTERYKSWYDELWEAWTLGPLAIFVGLIIIFIGPFVALYVFWKPCCIGSDSRRIHVKKSDVDI